VQPLSDKALQLACTDLANPGPNQVRLNRLFSHSWEEDLSRLLDLIHCLRQISIITLPLHEKPYHFRLNRKQIKQAQRNGVMVSVRLLTSTLPATVFRPKFRWIPIPLENPPYYRSQLTHSLSFFTLQGSSLTPKPLQTSPGDIAKTSSQTPAKSSE